MYSYTPLKTPTSFRLVHLLPNTREHAVHLNITSETLENAGDYQALSYEWQDMYGTCTVAVGDDRILITRNLYAALEVLRSEKKTNKIWIDAVCVNQNDPEERSSQVEIMREIYAGASRVIAWIGPELDGTKLAFDMLARFCYLNVECLEINSHLDAQHPSGSKLVFKTRPETGKMILAVLGNIDICESIQDILSRSYFERVWAIQEVAVSSSAVVYCGSCSIPFLNFVAAARYIFYTRPLRAKFHKTKIPNILAIFGYSGPIPPRWSGLFPMLQMFRATKASNPRDKVYALRGLVPKSWNNEEPAVMPNVNYEHSVEEVYHETALYLISSTSSLEILKACRLSEAHRDGKMPSWVPDWRISGPYIPATREFALTYKLPPQATVEFGQENDVTGLATALFLQAHIVDTAIWFNLTSGKDNVLQCSYELLNMVSKMKTEYVTGGSAWIAVWKTMIADTVNGLSFVDELSMPFVQFALVVCYGRTTTPVDHLLGRSFAKDPEPFTSLLQENLYAKALCSGPLTDTRFFLTKRGFFGLGPLEMKNGDVVAVVKGSEYPLVLRCKGYHYIVVGPCYLHGIMDGENLNWDNSMFESIEIR